MNISNLSLSELNSLSAKLNKRKERLEKGQVEKVRAKVAALLRAEGLTMQDLIGSGASASAPKAGKKPRAGGKAKRVSAAKGRKVAPKYQNPDNPKEVWTGRGRQPFWVRACLIEGLSLDDLLIPDPTNVAMAEVLYGLADDLAADCSLNLRRDLEVATPS